MMAGVVVCVPLMPRGVTERAFAVLALAPFLLCPTDEFCRLRPSTRSRSPASVRR
jgi:hypothetical protein